MFFIMDKDGVHINADAIESYRVARNYIPLHYSVTMFSGAQHIVSREEMAKVFPKSWKVRGSDPEPVTTVPGQAGQ